MLTRAFSGSFWPSALGIDFAFTAQPIASFNLFERTPVMRFKIEKLEERLAPCAITCEPDHGKDHCKGNNGFGNGGNDPAPGNSGTNGAPNADQKLADVVR